MKSPGKHYIDGKVDYTDYVEMNLFSIHELKTCFKMLDTKMGSYIQPLPYS